MIENKVESHKCYTPLVYFVLHDGHYLCVGELELPGPTLMTLIEQEGIIIWGNRGRFRLIPYPILCNARSQYEKVLKGSIAFPRIEFPDTLKYIIWEQGIDIPPVIVADLLSTPHEISDNLSDPNTPTDTTSEDHSPKP